MVRYDPNAIQTIAQRLYNQANSCVVVWTLNGTLIGLLAGLPSGGLAARFTDSTVGWATFVGCIILGFIAGLTYGRYRAAWLKFEAQSALCQVQIEINTRHIAAAMTATANAAAPAANPFANIQP